MEFNLTLGASSTAKLRISPSNADFDEPYVLIALAPLLLILLEINTTLFKDELLIFLLHNSFIIMFAENTFVLKVSNIKS